MNNQLRQHRPHTHHFAIIRPENERRMLFVVILTLVTMIAEITAGILTGSMALLSDGWHMGTHAGALGIALFAYIYSRKYADSKRYSFGTGKVGVLAAFTSAIILGVTGILIAYESVNRLLNPVEINFNIAILVAVIGLIVNLLCVWILRGDKGHHHSHHGDHSHPHEYRHHGETDYNYRAALLHVIADAMTSVFAIAALLVGKYFGLVWFDPVVGVLGASLILWWAYGLIRRTGHILLDSNVAESEKIREVIEADSDNKILDLHVWRVNEEDFAAIVSLVTDTPKPPEHYHELLRKFDDLKHVTVEVHGACFGET
jgi:cation diffusion facilitator family transporter